MSLPIATIQRRVAAHFGITITELIGPGKARRCSRPRHLAMYLARDYTGYSLPRIGQAFHRDHTTVLYALICVQQRIGLDPEFAETVAAVRVELTSAEE